MDMYRLGAQSHARVASCYIPSDTVFIGKDYLNYHEYIYISMAEIWPDMPLQWRHNGRDGVSNHQPHHCLLNRLFRRRSKKTSQLRVSGLCVGNSPVTGEFPAQMASNAENVSIWWRHHVSVERKRSHAYPEVGVTKASFVNFSVSTIFESAKVPVKFFAAHSYMTAAEQRRHLSYMNVVFSSQHVFWRCWNWFSNPQPRTHPGCYYCHLGVLYNRESSDSYCTMRSLRTRATRV